MDSPCRAHTRNLLSIAKSLYEAHSWAYGSQQVHFCAKEALNRYEGANNTALWERKSMFLPSWKSRRRDGGRQEGTGGDVQATYQTAPEETGDTGDGFLHVT